ncbi:MAG: class I adenylate-forming enzyme family protein [Aquabacterium sp.]
MLLHAAFREQCRIRPDRTAIVAGAQDITYAGLARRVASFERLLQAYGVRQGDRVVVYLDSSIEFAVAVHAVLGIGAVFVPVSPLTRSEKLAYMLDDLRAVALVTDTGLAAQWSGPRRRCASVRVCVVCGAGTPPDTVPWPADEADTSLVDSPADRSVDPSVDPSADPTAHPLAAVPDTALAAVIYTSGTTGVPKGVMLSHRNMCAAWRSVQSYLQLRDDDVIGLALSPAFSYGLYHLLMGLGIGATLVLERSAAFPARLVERLAQLRVTVFPGVPTLFSAILGLGHLARLDLSSIRLLTNAAAALSEHHIRQLQKVFPQAVLMSMYGMTECKRISYLPPEQLALRPTSVGRGMPGQDHWLVDTQGRRLPPGATGELVVHGDHVMQGYWDKPAETAARLRAGPAGTELHTGDIFRTDAEGWLYFVARSDDIIKSRGEKVAPREVENVIYGIDGVLDCAVMGVPDDALGQAVVAVVALRPQVQLTERDVIRHCLQHLESYMAPKRVLFRDNLPRTDSGKIRKVDLRHLFMVPADGGPAAAA